MKFEEIYGEIGKEFIHVHHLKPLAEIVRSMKSMGRKTCGRYVPIVTLCCIEIQRIPGLLKNFGSYFGKSRWIKGIKGCSKESHYSISLVAALFKSLAASNLSFLTSIVNQLLSYSECRDCC